MSSVTASLAERVQVVAAGLAALAGADGAVVVEEACAHIPGRVTSLFGFEVCQGRPGADVLVQLRNGAGFDASANAELSGHSPRVGPVMTRITGILDDPASPWAWLCNDVWLEYDLVRTGSGGLPAPSLFFSPWPVDRPSIAPHATASDVLEFLAHLSGEPQPALAPAYAAVFDELAAIGSRPLQHGMMLGRSGTALRLCLGGAPLTDTLAALSRAGWGGDLEALLGLAGTVSGSTQWCWVDVDLFPSGPAPRAALELAPIPGEESQFLASLADRGLVTPQWAAALLTWPGSVRQRTDPAGWPTDLGSAASLFGEGVESGLRRRLNHVKLVPGGEPKAYLAVDVAWAVARGTREN